MSFVKNDQTIRKEAKRKTCEIVSDGGLWVLYDVKWVMHGVGRGAYIAPARTLVAKFKSEREVDEAARKRVCKDKEGKVYFWGEEYD